ncbi:hypothetical protein AB6A40_005308 [Gnathostoma spinigerum]|uniref:GDP-fucose pyrophosphorylase domain-containing protein n=1 Tax=Gnathostoma spinigerum TaxID=75299 RepID=A0ABD6EF27_9BILA
MLWTAVVLTACDSKQKEAYETQIGQLRQRLKSFSENFYVFEDEFHPFKIGSGGATLKVLQQLFALFGDRFNRSRFLVIHSGGLSKRLPIASAVGKIFLCLPNEKTFLEMKVQSYRRILEMMCPGVLICASDTLEYIPYDMQFGDPSSDVVLFAHPSNVDIATQHGVYVLKSGSLHKVLQKPSLEKLKSTNALFTGDFSDRVTAQNYYASELFAYTDSFYIISSRIAMDLAKLGKKTDLNCELCCYGDFLGGLGVELDDDYLDTNELVKSWRIELLNIFRDASVEFVRLPSDSFFHFGTSKELLCHFKLNSTFYNRFLTRERYHNVILSSVASSTKIASTSVIQLCDLSFGAEVGENCLLYGCKNGKFTHVPDGIIATTIAIRRHSQKQSEYVTLILSIGDELKSEKDHLRWFDHDLKNKEKISLWDIPLFPVCESMEESLEMSLRMCNDFERRDNICLLSIDDVVQMKDCDAILRYQKELISRLKTVSK